MAQKMDLISMNDESFNLSDDFFDALSVIATTNPDFADTQQQQEPNPQMTTQCLIEEQQQLALQFTPQEPQSTPQLQQMNYQQQQQQHMFRQQQQQMIQQIGYQQQCQRQLAPQQQSMLQQQQRILAAYQQQQQQQQQYQSSTTVQNQPLNFAPQQQQQQTTAQQRLFSQQQLQYQRPAAPQLQNEQYKQSHALQLASQLQYQQTQNEQLPPLSHVQNQQTQVQKQQSRVIQLASQLQIQQSTPLQIQNNQAQVQTQNLPVSQLQQQQQQQQPNVGLAAPQIQVQFQNKQAQQSMPRQQQQQQPIQLTVAQQRLIAAHQQQQQHQPQNLAPKHRQTVDSQSTFPIVSQQQQNVQTSNTTTTTTTTVSGRVAPYIEIVEQPAPRASRFRYNCEVRDSGSIPGVNSTLNTKTFPTIRIVGYNGNAMVVVSCVTKDPPYRPHPHNLVGRSWCKNGICRVSLTSNRMSVTFDKLGIQCIKRKDFPASLELRKKEQVDPFRTGFEHKEKDKLASIDQNCVRLAFQAFLEGPKKGEFKIPLPAVVSNPIHDKKNSPDLTIYKMSHCSAPAAGDLEMILLCDRVTKEDIRVRFYEERDEEVVWEESVDVSRTGAVHKYVAIVFRSPKYQELDFSEPIHAKVELVRPSDGMYSNSLPFDFTPQNEPFIMQRKRKRLHESLLARDLETASTHSDQWSSMSHFNIIEAR